jgi:F-type H+-transporting ATPase subunit b
MISINSSIFIQIINFLVLIFILNKVLYRPIRGILIERKNRFNGLEKDIDNYQGTAEEKEKDFNQGIKEARNKGLKEKEAILQEAADEEKKIIGEIQEKAQAELARVKDNIRRDTEEVRESLSKEIDDFAQEIGKKILGRAI